MPVETICTGCGKRLRVGDEHAGKLARCPQCQTTYTVPHAVAGGPSFPAGASWEAAALADRWQLKTADGLTYGPISKAELDRWLAEGRVTPQSQVLQEGGGQWRQATEIYPQLAAASATSDKPNPFADNAGANPYTASHPVASYSPGYSGAYAPYNPVSGKYTAPHRGAMVLVFGILSVAFCALFGIPAVVMGLHDLREMKQQRMDPSGRGITLAGTIIGGVGIALLALTMLFVAVAVVADM